MDATFRCPKCGGTQSTRNLLVQHLRVSKTCGSHANSFACPNCRSTFPSPSSLGRHMARPKACQIQKRRQELQRLIADHSPAPKVEKEEEEEAEAKEEPETEGAAKEGATKDKDEASCGKCGEIFRSQPRLSVHQRRNKACRAR